MKTKLHFGILIILLTFLGRYLEHNNLPNQQVVIQFSDENISNEDALNTIEAIQKRLEDFGAEHIHIGQSERGQLKITYFSNANVESIQDILSSEDGFKFSYDASKKSSTNFPFKEKVKDYELNISEIQSNNNINWDFERVEIVELNQKSEHSTNLKIKISGEAFDIQRCNNITNVAIKVTNRISNATDNTSFNIPETRAGPINLGII